MEAVEEYIFDEAGREPTEDVIRDDVNGSELFPDPEVNIPPACPYSCQIGVGGTVKSWRADLTES